MLELWKSFKKIKVNHIRPKVDYISFSPYDETLLLDSDTIVNYDITDIFSTFFSNDDPNHHFFTNMNFVRKTSNKIFKP